MDLWSDKKKSWNTALDISSEIICLFCVGEKKTQLVRISSSNKMRKKLNLEKTTCFRTVHLLRTKILHWASVHLPDLFSSIIKDWRPRENSTLQPTEYCWNRYRTQNGDLNPRERSRNLWQDLDLVNTVCGSAIPIFTSGSLTVPWQIRQWCAHALQIRIITSGEAWSRTRVVRKCNIIKPTATHHNTKVLQ